MDCPRGGCIYSYFSLELATELGKCLVADKGAVVDANTPDAAGRDNRYPVQHVITRHDGRTRDRVPFRAVPLLNERLLAKASGVVEGAHSPDVVCGDNRHPVQVIVIGPDAGTAVERRGFEPSAGEAHAFGHELGSRTLRLRRSWQIR